MKLPRVDISAPALLLWALAVYLSPPGVLWTVLVPVLVHEAGHIAAIRLLGLKLTGLSIEAGGLEISYRGDREPRRELLIAAAGPLAGFLAAALFPALGERGRLAAGVSVLLSLFNLLPTRPLDGGRMAELLLPGISRPLGSVCRAALLAGGAYLSIKGAGAGLLAAAIFIYIAANAGKASGTVL